VQRLRSQGGTPGNWTTARLVKERRSLHPIALCREKKKKTKKKKKKKKKHHRTKKKKQKKNLTLSPIGGTHANGSAATRKNKSLSDGSIVESTTSLEYQRSEREERILWFSGKSLFETETLGGGGNEGRRKKIRRGGELSKTRKRILDGVNSTTETFGESKEKSRKLETGHGRKQGEQDNRGEKTAQGGVTIGNGE